MLLSFQLDQSAATVNNLWLQKQVQANAAAKQLEQMKLANSDLPLTDWKEMKFEQLSRILTCPKKFSNASNKVSVRDWTRVVETWMTNVRLPLDAWGRIATGSLAEPDSTASLDHVCHVGTDSSDLT